MHREFDILLQNSIVEDIDDPAFICRNTAILGANRAFSELVGASQADLIGAEVADVMKEGEAGGIVDFAKRRVETPDKGPKAYVTRMKTGQNGGREVHLTAGSLGNLKDIYLLVVRDI